LLETNEEDAVFFIRNPNVCKSDFKRKNWSLYFTQNPIYVGLFFNPLRPMADSHQLTPARTKKHTTHNQKKYNTWQADRACGSSTQGQTDLCLFYSWTDRQLQLPSVLFRKLVRM